MLTLQHSIDLYSCLILKVALIFSITDDAKYHTAFWVNIKRIDPATNRWQFASWGTFLAQPGTYPFGALDLDSDSNCCLITHYLQYHLADEPCTTNFGIICSKNFLLS